MIRRFFEEVAANCADLLLIFSDWLVFVVEPVIGPLEDALTNAFQDVFSLTRLIILVTMIVGVLL